MPLSFKCNSTSGTMENVVENRIPTAKYTIIQLFLGQMYNSCWFFVDISWCSWLLDDRDRALYIHVYMYKIWCDHERSFRLLCTYHVYANIYMRKWIYKSCMYSNLYDIRATLLICCHKLVDKLLHHMKSRGNQFHDEISLKCQAVPWKSKLLRGNPSCAKFSYG